jgi:large subunit ribosomal protein LP2
MRHLAAYLLLVVGGNSNPTAEDVTNALAQCGIDVDEERLNALIAELDGKDLTELIAEGREKLMVGGAAVAAAAPAAGGAAPAAAGAPAAAPKAAEKPKEEEVDALEGGMDMFGGGGGGDY